MDSGGGVLPGVTVTLQNLGTGAVRTVKTSPQGDYVFSLLQIGQYSVKVEAAGFKTFVQPSVALSGGDRARVDAKMEVGQVSESIEVAAVAPALQTDSAVLGSTVTTANIIDLPVNGRNFMLLAQMAPGATTSGPNAMSSGARPDDRRPTSAISVNGMTEGLNNYMIDGMDNNDRWIGTIGVRPSIDAMAEFRVQTSLYTADVSRTSGGVINVLTKSGTNEFHGSLYEFLRNDKLDANQNFSFSSTMLPRSEYRQNQFGGSIGGPIRKDKTFFFGDYEALRVIQGVSFTDRMVPTVAEKTGDFSALTGIETITDPVTGIPFPGNVIPSSRIDPVIKNILPLFPNPTSAGLLVNNYQNSVNRTQFSTTWDARVDHRFSDKDSLFGRYSFNDVTTFTPSPFPEVNGIFPGGCYCNNTTGQSNVSAGSYAGTARQRSQGAQINYVHVFTPALLMELRGGFMRMGIQSLSDNASNPNAATTLGIPNVNLGTIYTPGIPEIDLLPYSTLGDQVYLPELVYNNVFQGNGDIHWTKGPHDLKFGASYIKRQMYPNQAQGPRGLYIFNATALSGYKSGVGDTFADFLLDAPQAFLRYTEQVAFSDRQAEVGAFAQDDWRATRWLTLNLGVRYDIFTPFHEVHGYMSNWSPTLQEIVSAVPNPLNSAQTSNSTVGVPTVYHDFSPRIGFAATVAKGLVVRGGYGITRFQGLTSTSPTLRNAPFFWSTTGNCGAGFATPCPTLLGGPPLPPTGLNWSLTQPAHMTGLVTAIPANFVNPYVQQFSLNIQKDIAGNVISIGYVGNLTRKFPQLIPTNQPQEPSYGGTPAPRPLQAVLPLNPNISIESASAIGQYNAMQITFDRRLRHGLTVQAQNTWAHQLSNFAATASTTGAGNLQWLANWQKFDYGSGALDIRDRAAVLLTYQLPFGQSLKGIERQVGWGWELNTVIGYQTGLPLTVVNQANRLGILGGGGDRPNQVAPLTYPKELSEWFDPSTFAQNPIGFPGNERTYAVTGPPDRSWDLSAAKRFPIRERFSLQLRVEGFNILNHPNFQNPNGTMPSSFNPSNPASWGVLGKITALQGNLRQFQLALKLIF